MDIPNTSAQGTRPALRVRDPEHDSFGVTVRPWLRLFDAMDLVAGSVEGEFVMAEGDWRQIRLTGQEFSRFRGVSTPEGVAALASEYGLLWIELAERDLVGRVRQRPLWWWLLTGATSPAYEPVKDWVRLGGLLDLGYGLLGLLSVPGALRVLGIATASWSLLEPPSLPGQEQHGKSLEGTRGVKPEALWPAQLVFSGAARAGLLLHARADDLVNFSVVDGQRIKENGVWVLPPHLWLKLDSHGAAVALAGLLNPWLEAVRARVRVRKGEGVLFPEQRLPGSLLGQLWLQLANAALSEIPPRVCAWERCPGPPERPGVFLWRWGRTATGTKHRDSAYCHPRCKHAAAVKRYRDSLRPRTGPR